MTSNSFSNEPVPAPVSQSHPKQRLLFFVAQNSDANIRMKVRGFVLRLAAIRPWLNGPPRFVNTRGEQTGLAPGDMPIETIGGYIEIYSALPPWKLPREIDMKHFDEVSTLVTEIINFSREQSLAIEFELDGELIGAIEDGKVNRSLSEGLLNEWKRNLGIS